MDHLTEEQINEYVDHLLSSADAAPVERHLLGCAECRKKVDKLQQVFASLEGLPDMPFQKDLATIVMRKIEPSSTMWPERRPARKLPGWAAGLVWTIAALQIPLAGLAFVYAWPVLRSILAPIGLFFSPMLLGFFLDGRVAQSILTWSSQVQQVFGNLSTLPRFPIANMLEAILVLVVLLIAWAAGNYLLFNSNRKVTQ